VVEYFPADPPSGIEAEELNMTSNKRQKDVHGGFNNTGNGRRSLAGRATSRTGVGVIGCGEWGPNHIRTFQANPQAHVVAAIDADASRLDRIRGLYPEVECYTDHKKMLKDDRIKAVIIATPPPTHYALAREALLSGRHVLCEKPLCETSAQAAKLIALAKRQKLVLMVGHVFLFNPGIIKMKELADKGDLGRLYYMLAVRTNLGPIRKDCNAAFDLATHDISIFNWIMGSAPVEVSATGASFLQSGIEDVVSISLKYSDKVFATIQASWLNPKKIRQITLVGSQRMLIWDDLQLAAPVTCYDKRASVTRKYDDYGEFLRVSTWEGDVRMPKVDAEEPLKMQTRFFLDAIRKGSAERSGGDFSLGVVRVLDAIKASMRKNGRPIRIEA
jgi:predicted dehydrogenase